MCVCVHVCNAVVYIMYMYYLCGGDAHSRRRTRLVNGGWGSGELINCRRDAQETWRTFGFGVGLVARGAEDK